MKHLIVGGGVGLLFMAGGFWYGLRLKPLPVPQIKPMASAISSPASLTSPDPISLEALKKTSETMMTLNQALQLREQNVADREKKDQEKEDELNAERGALDRSHEQFKVLFTEFQQRLQLVEANQLDQLQKQADLYSALGPDQSIDLIRAMDDDAMIRLFSVMDTKPLAKLVAEWKTKYPDDTPRLLHALDGMAQVMPKDKIALSDSTQASATNPSDSPSATPSDGAAPDSPVPDPTAAPAADPTATPSVDPSAVPPADPAVDPSSTPPTDTTPTAPLAPPADSTPAPSPSAPVSTAASN